MVEIEGEVPEIAIDDESDWFAHPTSSLHTSMLSDSINKNTLRPECLRDDSMAQTCQIFSLGVPLVSKKKTFSFDENV